MEQNVNLKSKTIKVLEENTRLKKNLNSGGGFPKYYAKLQSHKKQD